MSGKVVVAIIMAPFLLLLGLLLILATWEVLGFAQPGKDLSMRGRVATLRMRDSTRRLDLDREITVRDLQQIKSDVEQELEIEFDLILKSEALFIRFRGTEEKLVDVKPSDQP